MRASELPQGGLARLPSAVSRFWGRGRLHPEKFRQAGRKVQCLPFLRWLHRFGRPAGVAYPLTREDKLRNYLLGRLDLGQPYDNVLDFWCPLLTRAAIERVLSDLGLPSLRAYWMATFKPAERPPRSEGRRLNRRQKTRSSCRSNAAADRGATFFFTVPPEADPVLQRPPAE